VGTFGIHGELKVNPLTDFPERFERTETIYVGDKRTPYAVEGAHLHKQQVLLRLRAIADATSAQRLRGARLWIPTAERSPRCPPISSTCTTSLACASYMWMAAS
jgi:16S rRNA processing protein RimM